MQIRHHRRVLLLGLVALLAVPALIATLWPERDRGPSTTASLADDPRSAVAVALTGLCEAADAADGGDLAAALGAFLGRAHGPLHILAASLDDSDRPLTARLLEAKADVEASLPARAPSAPDDLRALLDVTVEAADAVGAAHETC